MAKQKSWNRQQQWHQSLSASGFAPALRLCSGQSAVWPPRVVKRSVSLGNIPAMAKAQIDLARRAARLKSRPFKNSHFFSTLLRPGCFGAPEGVPFPDLVPVGLAGGWEIEFYGDALVAFEAAPLRLQGGCSAVPSLGLG